MKKIKFFLFVLFIVFTGIPAISQDKELTLEDAVTGQFSYLYPDYVQKLQWRGATENYTFVKDNILKQGNAKSDKTEDILKIDDLNATLKKEGVNEIKAFPSFQWISDNTMQFYISNRLVSYNLKSKKLELNIEYDKSAENIDVSGDKIAYTIENNLFIIDKTGKVSQITKDDNKGIVNGKAVHRNEWGINKGTFWSPKGNYLAFYRMDESMVSDYPLVDITKRVAGLKSIKYPMAGMKSHEVTLGIYNVATGQTAFVNTGEPKEQYLTNITWGPDEKSVYIAVLNREQNHMKFNQYDIASGNFVKTLFEEKNDRYVEPLEPAIFLKTKPNQFLWQSQRDGYNHIYLYDTEGKFIRQITKGEWVVTDIIGTDEKEEFVYYSSTAANPTERQTYKAGINSGLIFKITKEEGTHTSKVCSSGKYLIDSYSSTKIPKIVNIISADGKVTASLLASKNPLKDYKLGDMSISTIKAADNKTDLYCMLIKPVNFDPGKKYPAIIYVYGGPHDQQIHNSWLGGVSLWQYYMAQKGYVMLIVDNRGSANRGFEFESIIHRNSGVAESADQMKGVEYLKGLGYVDMNRIGVHGWSYGGFMTATLMTHYNNVFKVGVAGGPVTDWKFYEVMYGERYMDTPDENQEGYFKTSLLNSAKDLKGKLLIIHGYIDNTVVLQHSLSFIEECIKNRVQVDYFLYPTHEHNVGGPDRIHLMEKVTRYFDDYLK